MAGKWNELIRQRYRPGVAYRHVLAISQFHRIQASPGFRAAAAYVQQRLAEIPGLWVTVNSYPADGNAHFWSAPSFLEWDCQAAGLQLLDDAGQPGETLCDFAAIPISVIQRSIAVEGDFEVVTLPGGGAVEEDYAHADVRGKLILTDRAPGHLLDIAVRRHGAAGFLFYGMRAGDRSELDLPDARQYTSFWWPGSQQPDAFGFVLSPRQGQALRSRLAARSGLRVRARIAGRFYAGALEVVEAWLPGSGGDDSGQEVLLVAHLCHPQPGAHDNASGAAALLETIETLARLVAEGALARPRRGIRCLWVPEMTGTYAWLAEHEAEVRQGRWVAGLNLDMVGADQNASGSVWELVSLPQAAPGFADHLLSWLREPFLDGQRHCEAPFSAGSDHHILSDPTVNIPTPMLIQWPDLYYHTSADTADKVSPDSLGRSGSLAAIYACWLATAGAAEARWLGHVMVGRFRAQAGRLAAAAVANGGSGAAPGLQRYHRQNDFAVERMQAALGALLRLDDGLAGDIETLRGEVAAAAADEAHWVERAAQASYRAGSAVEQPAGREPWRDEAERWVPVRREPGPVDAEMAVRLCPGGAQRRWAELANHEKHDIRDFGIALQHWADGKRTIAEIADAVALETGEEAAGDLACDYFKLLADMGALELARHESS